MKHKQQFWIILFIVFLSFLGISVPYLIFPALFLNPDYAILPASWSYSSHVLLLGITLAAYPLAQFFGAPILGALSDDYGRKPILSVSLLISALSSLSTGFAIAKQNLVLLIISRFIAGLMEGNIAIARAMAADIKTLSKHETFGKINAAASIAYILGPILGATLADKNVVSWFNTATPFYCISFFFVGLTILSLFVLLETAAVSTKPQQTIAQRMNLWKRLSVVFANKHLKFFLITSTLFSFAVDIFYEFGPVYLTLKWMLGPPQLIYYNGILCFALALGNGYLPTLFSKKFPSRPLVFCSTTAFILLITAMLFAETTYAMMLIFGLAGLAIGVEMTFITVKVSNAASESMQGEALGVQMSLRVLGDGLICLLGGVLLIVSAKLILGLSIVVALATLIYYKRGFHLDTSR